MYCNVLTTVHPHQKNIYIYTYVHVCISSLAPTALGALGNAVYFQQYCVNPWHRDRLDSPSSLGFRVISYRLVNTAGMELGPTKSSPSCSWGLKPVISYNIYGPSA